jgi:hypothetical protein
MTTCARSTIRPEVTNNDATLRNAMLLDHQLLQRQQIFANLVHNNTVVGHATTASEEASRSSGLLAGREVSPSVVRYLALRNRGHGSSVPPLPFSGPSVDGAARQ